MAAAAGAAAATPDSAASKIVPNVVPSEELDALKTEVTKLTKKVDEMASHFKEELEQLEKEIDEEKKLRVTMQVEIDRLRRKLKESL